MVRLRDGSMVQSIPKLIPFPSVIGGCHQRKSKEGIPGGHRICRIPYCDENLCNNGWCEETMVGYNCTCSSGFQGRHCDEMIIQSTTEATTNPTTSPTTTMSERSDTTTSQNTTTSKSVTTEAKTKSAMSPTATMPERSEATTSQETTTSKSAELSTTDATTKATTSSTTTMSDTTTSQDTTTSKVSTTDTTSKPMTSPRTTIPDTTTSQETPASTCSSPPVEGSYGESFYNFSTCWMNHSSAVSACSEYGSHLVFIESQEEEDFIAQSVKYLGDWKIRNYWIGLTGLSPSIS
ncbi:cell wall protein DAN4-like [Strongylocentrotus purpuratus]|uniref:Uncharacterized protein n=1 Tax=Strongylocentrotus purpuratus TaxID=7668 RepID=A0A7M7NP95_STRPU|nr:cell wall protein DAN4-like [Strongylocentrotus purpuratus]